jgi:AcrR family transcriptional regulator
MPRVSAAHEQEVRERIVSAALAVFGERGYRGATIQDVVRESGLSVGAIYTYFSGKDELFLECCDVMAGRGLDALGVRLAGIESTAARLATAVSFFLETMDEDRDGGPGMVTLIQAWSAADSEPRIREMLVRRRERIVGAGQMFLQDGIARGELPPWIDVDATARAYVGLLDGLILQRIEAGEGYRRSDLERQVRAMVELILAAAAAPRRPDLPAV